MKILKNVAIVVEGFREGVEEQSDFLGFQRVEEYPSNRVKLEFYRCAALFYSEEIVGEITREQDMNQSIFEAYSEAVGDRYEELKTKYLNYLSIYANKP